MQNNSFYVIFTLHLLLFVCDRTIGAFLDKNVYCSSELCRLYLAYLSCLSKLPSSGLSFIYVDLYHSDNVKGLR